MRKALIPVISLLLLALFSCKSVDFRRIERNVEEIEAPPSPSENGLTMENIGEDNPESLCEDGKIVEKNEKESAERAPVLPGETENESEKAEETADASSLPLSETKTGEESLLGTSRFNPERILLIFFALLVVILLAVILVMARKREGKTEKISTSSHPSSSGYDSFEGIGEEVYLSSLDYGDDAPEGVEERREEKDEAAVTPEEIIAILKSEESDG